MTPALTIVEPPSFLKPTAGELAWAVFYQRERENAELELEIIVNRIGLKLMAKAVTPGAQAAPAVTPDQKFVLQTNPPPKAKKLNQSYYVDWVARKAGVSLTTAEVCLKRDGLDRLGRRHASPKTVERVKQVALGYRKAA